MCCFFKRKQPVVVIESQFKMNDFVRFRDHKGELCFGYIYAIRLDDQNKVIYDIQVGGECPAIKSDIPEEVISLKK